MILFIIGVVMTLLAIPAYLAARRQASATGYAARENAKILRIIAAALATSGLVAIVSMSITVVPTRNLAVQTEFGKPTGTLTNGFHLVAPWSSIETFDATVQTLRMSGEKEDNGDPITVRLANSATATVDVTVQWQVDPNADITSLYLDYRNFENIGSNVVRRQMASALNAVFEGYDPLISLEGGQPGPTLAELAERVSNKLDAQMPKGVKIRSVLIPRIAFEASVQEKLNQYLAALAETQIAQQREVTAEALKRANNELSTANNTPGVLYQNCLDMVERLTKEGKALPAAFTCGLPPTAVVPVR